ncbi:MAG TPA: hypothetical protein VF247_06085 [Candidatus Krumholzibacteria bacterium]
MPKAENTYAKQVKARVTALRKVVDPITHQLEIRWEPTAKKWMVTSPDGMVWRGLDKVEWKLVRGEKPDVEAHFQFPDMKLFADFGKQDRLSKDKTAKIGKREDNLVLQVHADACRRSNPHYYAVWISDREHPNGGEFAVGQDLNPPPEVTVGP